jgi:hypothetical protein
MPKIEDTLMMEPRACLTLDDLVVEARTIRAVDRDKV